MTYPLTTTLAALREAGACFEGYNRVVRMLQGRDFTDEDTVRESYMRSTRKESISLVDICNNNCLENALWALRCVKGNDRNSRLYAVWCARQVEHLSDDPRVKACNDVAERFANGMATEEDLGAARYAVWSTAGSAARSAAGCATGCAARSAAWSAAWHARSAAGQQTRQKEMFIEMCEGNAPWQLK